MKFSVSFKSPDAVYWALQEDAIHLEPSDSELQEYDGDADAWREERVEELKKFVAQWVYY